MPYFDENEDRIIYGRGHSKYGGFDPEECEWGGRQPSAPRCNRCGSTDVRWRQQGGKWVLFSLTPGVEHACPIPDDFDVVPE